VAVLLNFLMAFKVCVQVIEIIISTTHTQNWLLVDFSTSITPQNKPINLYGSIQMQKVIGRHYSAQQ